MQKTLLIILLIISSIQSSYAQTIAEDTLYHYEQKIFQTTNDTIKNSLLLNKFNYVLKLNPLDTLTYREANRINFKLIQDKEKQIHFLWNASLLNLLFNDQANASYYHEKYIEVSKDTSVRGLLLGFTTNKKYPTLQQNYLKRLIALDSSFNVLSCYKQLNEVSVEDSTKFMRLAKRIPGIGLIKLNEKKRGYFSMIAHTALSIGIASLCYAKLYFNAIEVSYVYLYRFYQGNILLTENVIQRKIKSKKNELTIPCELALKNLLSKFTINFILL
ncbi:MAG: hypothetical protein KA264_08765 [Crocinitomicaceae bacterium]|jgi:hypothetical protein|nr:hypothetical protein [Crocinitomicaceae bacterium]